MSIRVGALRETITIFNRANSGTDRYGNPVLVEGTGVAVPAAVMPLDATEQEIAEDRRVQRYRVTVAPDVALTGLARIAWRGRSLEVIGEPIAYSAHGNVHQQEFEVREVLG